MTEFIERHYRAIVIITLLMTGALSLQLPRLHLDSSFEGWVHSEGALHQTYLRFTRRFGADDQLLLVFKTGDLMAGDDAALSAPPLERYQEAVADLAALPAVTGVIDPVRLYLENAALDGGLALLRKDEPALARLRERLSRAAPGDWGRLASRDLQTLGLLLSLDPARRQGYPEIVQQIQQRFRSVGIPFQMAGVPYFSATLAALMARDLTLVVSLLVGVALLVLFYFLRLPRLVFSIVAGIGVSLAATLGLGLLAGLQITLLTLVLFPLLFCVGLTTAIHFFSRREAGRWRPEMAYARVLRPAAIAMLTTAVGTASFLFAPQPAIHGMGMLLPLGIVLTFLAVMFFTPALFRWLSGGWALPPARHAQRAPFGGRGRGLVALLLGAAALGAVPLAGEIRVNPDAIFFFQPQSELVQSYRQIEAQLSGLLTVELMISAAPDESVLRPDRQAVIRAFLRGIEKMPGLTDGVNGLDLQIPAFLTADRRAVRVSLHYRNLDGQPFQAIERRLRWEWRTAAGENSGLRLAVTGQLPLILMGQAQLLHAQARVFLWIFLLVSLLLFVLLRSGRILLLALLANFIPLLITAGAMALLGIAINSINLFVASVLLGVIVDDSIHLLHAYRETGEMHRVLEQVRPALWITSVTVALAFATLGVSQIAPVVQFGLLSVIAVVSAYLCDTCLLPLLAPARREKT